VKRDLGSSDVRRAAPSADARQAPRDGDEQDRAPTNAHSSREAFHLFVEAVKDYAIFMLDPEGQIISWNVGAERIKGYRAREILGQHFSLFYPPEDVERGKPTRQLEEAAAKGSAEDEGWRVRKDGSRFWANVVITAVRDATGQLRGFAKVTRDITERRRMEDGLRLYMDLVRNAPVGLMVVHMENPEDVGSFRILAANPAIIRVTGMQHLTVEDVIGKTLAAASPAVFETELPAACAAVIRSGRPRYVGEIHHAEERVPEVFFSVQAFPLPNCCAGVAFENITKRKLAEESLVASEARTRLIVDTAHDAFVAIDIDGRVTDWNRQAEIVFGWKREEAKGKLLAEMIIPQRYRGAHQRGLEHFMATGEGPFLNQRVELTALRRNGEEFPIELTVAPIHWEKTWLFSAFVRDITERKRTDEALRRTAADLTRSNAELEQFAYVASHDLQEPLRAVASSTQLLARAYHDKLDAEAREYIDFALGGAKRMQVLINELLSFARLGARRKPFARIDCQKIYQAATANLQVAINESGAVLTTDLLPTVLGDQLQLIQLFQNLLANAIKFRGENTPRIHVAVTPSERECQFAVRDNGIGIDPKDFNRLFVIFQRLHGRDEYPGTGIGLAVCKKIVEQHGGHIWVDSAPGTGSTFYFTIPVANSRSSSPDCARNGSVRAPKPEAGAV